VVRVQALERELKARRAHVEESNAWHDLQSGIARSMQEVHVPYGLDHAPLVAGTKSTVIPTTSLPGDDVQSTVLSPNNWVSL
jgi:hypothetical protein